MRERTIKSGMSMCFETQSDYIPVIGCGTKFMHLIHQNNVFLTTDFRLTS